MELTEILRCPKTGNKLRFSDADSAVYVEGCDVSYPIIDGIVDFCPEVRDAVSESYDGIASRYDSYITSSSLLMKALDKFVWRAKVSLADFHDRFLPFLPDQFDGVLLDVPVGTGVFTDSLYARFPNATIIAVDYSMGMLQKAKDRFEQQGLKNVCLVRADVANLPLTNGAADFVLSMNGLHAFPDKQRAISEMRRVLCEDGSLIGSCYVKGDRKLTDWYVKYIGVRKGFFSPPFYTKDNIGSQLEGLKIRRQGSIESGVYFEAVKVV
jgi:ubiquinone/menaquinone biosynthesis C-methylase UbiE